jgi:hypothetical protein
MEQYAPVTNEAVKIQNDEDNDNGLSRYFLCFLDYTRLKGRHRQNVHTFDFFSILHKFTLNEYTKQSKEQ